MAPMELRIVTVSGRVSPLLCEQQIVHIFTDLLLLKVHVMLFNVIKASMIDLVQAQ